MTTDVPPLAPTHTELVDALIVLFHAVDARILPEAVYADLARLRIAIAQAFPDGSPPCEPGF